MRSKNKSITDSTDKGEEEIFENFKIDLSGLKPGVREKATELAKEMMKSGMPKEQAITKGIQEAETWFLESQG
ncbi:hypothetical protein SAMN04487898_106130 [Pedobacter sp. ok626]|uniref:hypothetical protein n=1 Tax=Pedobacter sp. ok626 TaxID=1761882 RepID=UPI000890B632|nr:hypothetical protein [Pedobacter sp. ok626]SDK13261.1 hypothetical protein SAMN04487898_106130 [Pedobacter sp. ok626]